MSWSQIFLDLKFRSGGRTVGVQGESEYAGYEGQIVLLDFGWGMSAKNDGARKGNAAQRRMKFGDLTLVKRFDDASVALLSGMRNRDPVESACVSVVHALNDGKAEARRKAFEIKLVDARIESINLGMSEEDGSMVLREDLTLAYSTIYVKTFEMDADGIYTNRAKTYTSRAPGDVGMNA